jgi:hypothetical protein
MIMELLVVVREDVTARERPLKVSEEVRVDRHHVLEVTVLGTVLHHQDLTVALDDLRLDLADFFGEEDFLGEFPVQNLLPDLRNALRTEGVCLAGPAERRLGLLPGLEKRLF